MKRPHSEPRALALLAAAHSAALAAYAAASGYAAALAALPAAAAAAAGVGPWRELLVAALALEAAGGPLLYLAVLPALAAAPLLYRCTPSRPPPALIRSMLPMGPSWYRVSRRAATLIAAGLVDPWFAAAGAALLAAAGAYTLHGYVRLGRSRARLARAPERVVRGSKAYIAVEAWIPGPAWLLVSLKPGSWRLLPVAGGRVEAWLPLDTGRVGEHRVHVTVFTFTIDGFSQRLLLDGMHEYRVMPVSVAAAESLAAGLLARAGGEPGGPVEAAFYEQRGPSAARLEPRVPPLVESPQSPAWLLSVLYSRAAAAAGVRRARRGEYIGVRLYVPGDDPRLVHWKKSVSTGRLVVREYASSAAAAAAGVPGDVSALVVDLAASSREELDDVVSTLLAWLSLLARSSPTRSVLVAIHYAGRFLVLRGARVDVLREVAAAAAEALPRLLYDYESGAMEPPEEALEAIEEVGGRLPGLHGLIAARVLGYVRAVEALLRRSGVPAGSVVVLVYPRPALLRGALLERRLTRFGVRVSRAGPAASSPGRPA